MKILLNVEGNLGYGPDQVKGMRLGDLLAAAEEAVAEWGEDAELVLHQSNNGYGANFGRIATWATFDAAEVDDEDEEV